MYFILSSGPGDGGTPRGRLKHSNGGHNICLPATVTMHTTHAHSGGRLRPPIKTYACSSAREPARPTCGKLSSFAVSGKRVSRSMPTFWVMI